MYFDVGANVLIYVQGMLHTLIAVNRFTAFFFPMKHSSLWNKHVVAGSLAMVAVIAILLHLVPRYIVPLWAKDPHHNFGQSLYGTQVIFSESETQSIKNFTRFEEKTLNFSKCFL